MGGTASSQATDSGDIKSTDAMNFGLVNLSSESSTSWNIVEIITCLFVAVCLLYLASYWCQKRRAKKLARLAQALQTVTAQPDAARLPVYSARQPSVQSPPPAPPAYLEMQQRSVANPVHPTVSSKSSAEELGAQLMSRYT